MVFLHHQILQEVNTLVIYKYVGILNSKNKKNCVCDKFVSEENGKYLMIKMQQNILWTKDI